MHTLYLANREGQPFSEHDRGEVAAILSGIFPAFTLIEATGYWRGRILPTLAIKLASEDHDAVDTAAEELRLAFQQQAVGIESEGRYRRITGPDAQTYPEHREQGD
ncbi:MAG: hypothetical protein RID91_13625 [Azospirillaceae bacterium]